MGIFIEDNTYAELVNYFNNRVKKSKSYMLLQKLAAMKTAGTAAEAAAASESDGAESAGGKA